MDSFAIQNAIRNNANEMNDYLKGIQDWQKEMKIKDDNFNKQSKSPKTSKTATKPEKSKKSTSISSNAPIRNISKKRPLITEITHSQSLQSSSKSATSSNASQITPATITTQSLGKQSKPTRISSKASSKPSAAHTYDYYKKWDKIDIDAELNKTDSDSDQDDRKSQNLSKTSKTLKNTKTPLITEISTRPAATKKPQSPPIPIKKRPVAPEASQTSQSSKASKTLSDASNASADRIRAMEAQMGAKAPARSSASESKDEQAERLKREGNEHFARGRFALAVESYIKAIKLAPDNAKLYANRALVRLKCNDFELCERDCTECIRLDANFVKAWYRRGVARRELKKFEEALEDFKHILTMEPKNELARKEILLIESKLKKQEIIKQKEKERLAQRARDMKQEQERRKQDQNAQSKGMRRVIIEEGSDSDSDSSESDNGVTATSAATGASTGRKTEMCGNDEKKRDTKTKREMSASSTKSVKSPKSTKNATNAMGAKQVQQKSSNEVKKQLKPQESKNKDVVEVLNGEDGLERAEASVEEKKSEQREDGLCKDIEGNAGKAKKEANGSNEMGKKAVGGASEKELLLSYLKNTESICNFIEFEKLWDRCSINNIGGNDISVQFEFQTQILWKIRLKNWKKLFENMMGDELFTAVLKTIHYIMLKKNKVKQAWKMLNKLSEIDRFEMLVMFMEDEDMSHLKEMKHLCQQKALDLQVFDKFLE